MVYGAFHAKAYVLFLMCHEIVIHHNCYKVIEYKTVNCIICKFQGVKKCTLLYIIIKSSHYIALYNAFFQGLHI